MHISLVCIGFACCVVVSNASAFRAAICRILWLGLLHLEDLLLGDLLDVDSEAADVDDVVVLLVLIVVLSVGHELLLGHFAGGLALPQLHGTTLVGFGC